MKTKIIAEVGCNHQGDFELAKKFIYSLAVDCNVDVIKFQKRNSKELLSLEEYNAPHPNQMHSFGQTYGEHREFLELTVKQHQELKKLCDKLGVVYSTSVWDLTSAKEITQLNPELIKIPSACNLNFIMLEYLAKNYFGEIHLSLGMTSAEEEYKIIDFFKLLNRTKDLIIYHCTSGYPIKFEDTNLLQIKLLQDKYQGIVKGVGFSSHTLGIAIEPVAVALGAKYIEKHVTFDRTWKGTDNAASLEMGQVKKLVRNIRATERALKYKAEDILEIEKAQRQKLKRLS